MTKLFKLLFLFAVVYDDLRRASTHLLSGKPERDGVFLLGAGTHIKTKLLEELDKHLPIFDVGGDGKHSLPCDRIKLLSNNIYLYSYSWERDTPLCDRIQSSLFITLSNSVAIPFYIKWLGYSAIHFGLFGQYPGASESQLLAYSKTLPVGSTITLANSTEHTPKSLDEELILNDFSGYISNPYIRFANHILFYPGNNLFIVHSDTTAYSFAANADQILECSGRQILNWQLEQIKSFIQFVYEVKGGYLGKSETELLEFFGLDPSTTVSVGNLSLQGANLVRYQELLLFKLVVADKVEDIRNLVESGVNINSKLLSGATPLYLAASLGREQVVKLLLDLEADIEARAHNNSTALLIASLRNQLEITKLLLSYGANIESFDDNGNNALILAAAKGNDITVNLLLSSGIYVDHTNKLGDSALSIASSLGYVEVAKQLLKAGANINIKVSGETPISLAISQGQIDILKLLLSYGAEAPILDEQPYMCNDLIRDEVISYQVNHLSYILSNNNKATEAIKALNNIAAYNALEENIKNIEQIKSCLSELPQDQFYSNLSELCTEEGVNLLISIET